MSEKTVTIRVSADDSDILAKLEEMGLAAQESANQITDAFGAKFKAKMDAAFKALPSIDINADSSEADAKIAEVKTALDTLRKQTVGVDIDDGEAMAKIAELKAALIAIGSSSDSAKIKIDTSSAIASLTALEKESSGAATDLEGLAADAEAAAGGGGAGGGGGIASLGEEAGASSSAIGPMAIVVGALATALIPIAATAAGGALALTAMAVAGGAAVGAFGLAALPIFSQVSTALTTISADQKAVNSATTFSAFITATDKLNKDLSNLSPVVAGITLGALQAKQAFSDWSAQFDPAILSVFSAALADVKPILNDLTPLVLEGANVLQKFFVQVGQVANSQAFKQFIVFLSAEAGPAIQTIITAVEKFGQGFATALEKAAPIIPLVEQGIIKLSTAFANFVASKTFTDFINWVVQNGPTVITDLENIAKAVLPMIPALANLGLAVLNFIGAIAGLISKLSQFYGAIVQFFLDPMGEVQTVAEALPGQIDHVWGDITSALQQAWGVLAGWVSANVIQPIENAWLAIVGFISPVWGEVVGAIETVWSVISGWVDANVVQPIIAVYNTIAGAVSHVWSDLVSDLEGAWNIIAGWVTSNVVDPIVNTVGTIATLTSHVWTDITGAIHGAFDTIAVYILSNVVQPILQGFVDIASGAADAFGWVPGLGGAIKGAASAGEQALQELQAQIDSLRSPPPITVTINTIENVATNVFSALAAPFTGHAAGTGMGTFDGLTWVGEKGPELINTGKPVQILNNKDSMALANGGGSSEPVNATFNMNFYGVSGQDTTLIRKEIDGAFTRLNQMIGARGSRR